MTSIARKTLLLFLLLTTYVSITGARCNEPDKHCTGDQEKCDIDGNGIRDGRCVGGICVEND